MNEKLKKINLIDELNETMNDVRTQLCEDDIRWGDTWKKRGLVYDGQAQEVRFYHRIKEYFDDWVENGTDIPWNKVIGEAHICKVREKKMK